MQTASQPATVDMAGAARMVGVSVKHFRKLYQDGLTPQCVNLGGRLRRWHIATLERWLAEGGCTPQTVKPTMSA